MHLQKDLAQLLAPALNLERVLAVQFQKKDSTTLEGQCYQAVMDGFRTVHIYSSISNFNSTYSVLMHHHWYVTTVAQWTQDRRHAQANMKEQNVTTEWTTIAQSTERKTIDTEITSAASWGGRMVLGEGGGYKLEQAGCAPFKLEQKHTVLDDAR